MVHFNVSFDLTSNQFHHNFTDVIKLHWDFAPWYGPALDLFIFYRRISKSGEVWPLAPSSSYATDGQ